MSSKTVVTTYQLCPRLTLWKFHFSTGIHPGKVTTVEVSLQNLILPNADREPFQAVLLPVSQTPTGPAKV